MENEQQLLSRVHLPFRFAAGATASRFFKALRDEKTIYGVRCIGCGRVTVPARSLCSACHRPMALQNSPTWVALPDKGALVHWGLLDEDGFAVALIQLSGADNLLLHRVSCSVQTELQPQMPVRAVWRDAPGLGAQSRRGGITDIDFFLPQSNAFGAADTGHLNIQVTERRGA